MMAENRNKGGRPKKDLGQTKTYRINIKLITEEYYSLVAKVKNAGTTVSDFVRECLKNGYVKERITAEQIGYIRTLCGMANNLNQIAKRANTGGYADINNECKCLIGKIESIIELLEQ